MKLLVEVRAASDVAKLRSKYVDTSKPTALWFEVRSPYSPAIPSPTFPVESMGVNMYIEIALTSKFAE